MSTQIRAPRIEPIAMSSESTVVAEFVPHKSRNTAHQSEAELERVFIEQLQAQAYEYLSITSEKELIDNLRNQLQRLNNIEFSDAEWDRFFKSSIAGDKDGPIEKTNLIQDDYVQTLIRDDGQSKNILLINKEDIHRNRLQVINQYESQGVHLNRYDVTILVNGLPLVHVELKRRGVNLREAFNQINRYQRESFWAGSGLFEYVQLFVISNGSLTKYYSNTVRRKHVDQSKKHSAIKTSDSYSFTTWWADMKNNRIDDLTDFTSTFLSKHSLLNILTRYCVFDVDQKLLVMRPYQIVATEQILQRINIATNYKQLGKVEAGGFIWHATGSGKTLTSFKVAQLARGMSGVEKVLFVVDRKDLDYQTMLEYDRFEKGAANSNKSTKQLQRQLEDSDSRLIITTIQKLSLFVQRNKKHSVYQKHVVIIFDECHRSQFGDMHADITKAFKRYHLFGFTGTPIFTENASAGGNPKYRTTEQVFGDKLHAYTIVDAIKDENVLPFRIDYVDTIKTSPSVEDEDVSDIDREGALLHPERIKKIVGYIIERFNQKTKRPRMYRLGQNDVSGFNSLFATDSIKAARLYYQEFRKQQADKPSDQQLKIGLIYSFAPNEDEQDGLLGEENFEPDRLDKSSRDFLQEAIRDYNEVFSESYDTSSEKFQNYYKDLSRRIRNKDLDLVIVVNMLLTGFDATTLNTLWVDKKLRSHGLIQAYSRTNRILNSIKTYGNIVTFRDLEEATNDAIALFGNKDAKGIVLLKPYQGYYNDYKEKIDQLTTEFPLNQELIGEENQRNFVKLYGKILRLLNVLTAFDQFEGNEILTERDFQDYQSRYIEIYENMIDRTKSEKVPIGDDLVFEIELIKSVEINVDYILMLVEEYLAKKGEDGAQDIRDKIERQIKSSLSLRSKKDLIDRFVESVTSKNNVGNEWGKFIKTERMKELKQIIKAENLNPTETVQFIQNSFRNGAVLETGTAISKILPATASIFGGDHQYSALKDTVFTQLNEYFERFYDLIEDHQFVDDFNEFDSV
ncbi:MAG: type I restriction endonuclease subunit R [Bacteroidetes bacterium]|nr:type I restriction endonuclease subunit R [Bacteroidota bacterium]